MKKYFAHKVNVWGMFLRHR